MKLVHSSIDTHFAFDGHVNTLTVESGSLFREYCIELCGEVRGSIADGLFVLSEGEKILPMAKHCALCLDITSMDFSEKKLLNRLYAQLLQVTNDAFASELTDLNLRILTMLDCLNSESSIPIEYETEAPFDSIMKAYGVRPSIGDGGFTESLVAYMEMYRSLLGIKLFCFVNLKSYLSRTETIQLFDYVTKNEINVFLLEAHALNTLETERQVVIDNDFCEILV